MKTRFRSAAILLVLPLFMILLLQGCKKDSDTTTPSLQTGDLMLKGSVIDASTNSGMGALVFIAGQTITAGNSGIYEINCKLLGAGTHDVLVATNEYSFGTAIATVQSDAALVRTVRLTPVTNAANIPASGGTITMADPESLLPEGTAIMTVAPGTFNGSTVMAFTRYTGADVPGYAPAGMLNLCTFRIDAVAVVPGKPLTVTLPLPVSAASAVNLALLKFDPASIGWTVVSGVTPTMNVAANTATVQVDAFGYYSLGLPGSFSETAGTATTPVTVDLDRGQSLIALSFNATTQFTGSIPYSVSTTWLKNLVSQNTKLYGERISFDLANELNLNYIGYKPDSVVTSRSAGYYRWMPRVTYTDRTMPFTLAIDGAVVTGTIGKRAFVPSSAYQFVHDQGGGGK